MAAGYAVLAWTALPARVRSGPRTRNGERTGGRVRFDARHLAVLRDRRYVVFLVATLLHTGVYAQYLSTLPLDVTTSHVPTMWYTLAVSLNGLIVIAFELPLTKVTQRWPFTVTIGLAFALLGAGVVGYGLPIGPAVILGATAVWTAGEIIGGPAIFAYPAIVAPKELKSWYIGSFQFVFGLGFAIGPAVGGVLFSRLGHRVWPVLAMGSLIATSMVLASVRKPDAAAGNAAGERAAGESVAG
jgi:MFS family permease